MGSKKTRGIWINGALAAAGVAVLLVCCAVSKDAISNAEAAEQRKPSIAETKAIAEEGFIYGLPIVMNYAVMNEFGVDQDSGQFKGPVQPDQQRSPRLHLQGHGDCHAQQRHALFVLWLDLRAEPLVLSVPAVDKSRYYAVELIDGNTYNFGYIGSRATGSDAGDYLVVGPDWKGETPAGIKKVFRSTTQFAPRRYPHPAVQCGRYAERG